VRIATGRAICRPVLRLAANRNEPLHLWPHPQMGGAGTAVCGILAADSPGDRYSPQGHFAYQLADAVLVDFCL
jgi:hypothetical protein